MNLSGMRVLDLSRFLPGPYLTMVMADHGAEVIKVESHQGEHICELGFPGGGPPVYFRNTQRGKLSLTLNPKHGEGREIFLRLAAQSDVLVESFRPGVMDRFGLGYQAVQKRAPAIIYCSLSAFGQTGPLSQPPSHDLGAQALTGVLMLSQAPGCTASLPTLPLSDIALRS